MYMCYIAADDFYQPGSSACSKSCVQAEATKRWPSRQKAAWDGATFELGVKDTERKRKTEEALVLAIWHS